MGTLRAAKALPALRAIAGDGTNPAFVRAAGLLALDEYRDPALLPTLVAALEKSDAVVAEAAAAALGKLPLAEAGPPLLRELQALRDTPSANPDLLKRVVESLGILLADKPDAELAARSIDAMLAAPGLLQHRYLRVCNRTATALGRIGLPAAIEPLSRMIRSQSNAKLVAAGAAAIGRLAASPAASAAQRQRAADVLILGLHATDNDSVRIALADALAQFQPDSAMQPLTDLLGRVLRADQPGVAAELVRAIDRFGPEAAARAAEIRERYDQQLARERLAAGDAHSPLPDRLASLREAVQTGGRQTLNGLRELLDDHTAPLESLTLAAELAHDLMEQLARELPADQSDPTGLPGSS